MEYKNFRSLKNTIFISGSSGHTASIGKEWESVPSILWPEAYSLGAISEDMQPNSMDTFIDEKKKLVEEAKNKEKEEVKEVLQWIYDRA